MDPSWLPFYQALASGAATLSGLLFVAISINVDVIVHPDRRGLRNAALRAFVLFLAVFFIAVLLLQPTTSGAAAGGPVVVVAAVVLLVLGYVDVQYLRSAGAPRHLGRLWLPVLTPVALLVALLGVGGALLLGAGGLPWLARLLAATLAVAAGFAWRLLVDVAYFKRHPPDDPAAGERARGIERELRSVARQLRAQNRRQQESARPAGPALPPAAPPRPSRDRLPRG